jgi:hypothetical protein
MLAAANALKKPIFKTLKDSATIESKRYATYQEAYSATKAAREKLVTDSTNADASLAWGRFLCCFKEDWSTGLPLLAQSNDKVWKSLAERELTRPVKTAELLELGDDWFKVGEKEKDPIQFQTRERAILAWDAAMVGAKDVELPKLKQQVNQRIAKLFEKSLATSKGDANGVPLAGTEAMTPDTAFTIEFWVLTTSKVGILLSKQHTATDSGVRLRLSVDQGIDKPKVHFEYAHPGGNGGTDTPNVITDGQWHHVALTKQGQTLKLFIDGIFVSFFPLQDDMRLQSVSPWKLGCGKNGPSLQAQFARVRISSVERYTNNFVPKKQFTKDSTTLYLR